MTSSILSQPLASTPSFTSYHSHSSSTMQRNIPSALGSIKNMFGRKTGKASETHSNRTSYQSPTSNMNPFSNPNDPPPAYISTPAPISSMPAPAPSPIYSTQSTNFASVASSSSNATTIGDSRYDFLKSFDTIFLIDDSGSMAGSRWREVSQALEQIVPICVQYDTNGVDMVFLNSPSKRVHSNIKEASTVHEIFSTVRPSGGTPTGQCLSKILRAHTAAYEANPRSPPKPVNIIVLTDGEPSDDVESPIVRAAKKLDALDAESYQIGIQFVQVGGDESARAHLESLDDCLSDIGGGCRDIVDTVPFLLGRTLNADMILKVVLGAVNKRLDRKKNVPR